MSEYLNEVMRISDVANNGDGIYPDPEDETMVIIRNGDSVMKVPAAILKALKECLR